MSENKEKEQEETIETPEKLDIEAFNVVQRLYDGTFKELVNR